MLAPIWQDVVVIGAAALQIVLAHAMTTSAQADTTTDLDLAIVTPTQDVDLALEVAHAQAVVACLEEAGLSPSTEESEQGFTWIRDDLKIQLVRPFHPFPNDTAKQLPANTHLSLLAKEEHRLLIAFDALEVTRFR